MAHAVRNRPHHSTGTCTKQQSSASTQNISIQLEEWGGLEENAPPKLRLSAPSFKARCLYSLRNFNFCSPKRTQFPKSCDSCYENPSENSKLFERFRSTHFICNPQGRFMFVWLGIVAMATVYNLWTAIMRQAFHEVQKDKTALWIGLDGVADLIYLADIMVQFRTSYLEKGLVVRDARKIATRYLWSRKFAFDSLALLPFDLFQLVTGIQPLLRFPRFLKCFRAWHWKIMVENRTTFPNTWRVLTLTHILFLGCHWFASIYYILSESTHFQDSWGYPAPTTPELQSLLRKYLQSFYWATLTLTTIGDITAPEATFQRLNGPTTRSTSFRFHQVPTKFFDIILKKGQWRCKSSSMEISYTMKLHPKAPWCAIEMLEHFALSNMKVAIAHFGAFRTMENTMRSHLLVLVLQAYAFTITTYLLGVFVFATIVGQVGTIINNRNAARLSFENLLDNAKSYMSTHHVPQRLRNRVLRWYDYAWERRRLFGENDLNCLGHLPEKLKTELALHVHLETLKKVTIFHECRPEFLHDLVLKMRPYIFTPGDLICRKGEVAREMFIIADGVLEVIGKAGIVLKRLEAGDFFGEIGILCINGGGNKRTADVRAVGYAELFVLSREDVLSALADHPDAHTIIMEHATQRLMESKSREDAQVTLHQQPTDLAPSETTASRGTEEKSILMYQESQGAAGSALNEIALTGPSRFTGGATAAVRAASTSTATSPAAFEAHYQTFAVKHFDCVAAQFHV
ncbi:cGMP-gated cation channel alpha-1 [Echinococcus granulosus]|uniref:cGMP-gated cation channel alpha-1 n=1 Tax=Echinococcus granulosus TaxID=6210 RepID=W6USM9_ECHGR|nr:cGMP-gated cation channel alpha-1 [Echinococcus granulosus]EUB63656.1 cGMP-gated cation channel alpha-1 [Echinococcus granulosus]